VSWEASNLSVTLWKFGNYKRISSLWYSENLHRQFSSFTENKQCTVAALLLGYGEKIVESRFMCFAVSLYLNIGDKMGLS